MDIYTIYRATNLINGKCYIGFDSNWPRRQKAHQRKANNNTGQYFHRAIRKHGWTHFIWDIVYQSLDGHHCLNTMEAQFILENKAFGDGYNCTKGGDGAVGWHASLSTEEKAARAKKISDAQLNKSPEEKAATSEKMSAAKLNKSPEEKAATSKRKSDAHRNRSPAEKAVIAKKKSDTQLNKSPAEKAATSKRKSDAQLNRSPEEKAAS